MNGENDKARFERIVLPYLADAYALARSIAGNAADAEDILQELPSRLQRIGRYGGGTRAPGH